jgi:hypothetical protein
LNFKLKLCNVARGFGLQQLVSQGILLILMPASGFLKFELSRQCIALTLSFGGLSLILTLSFGGLSLILTLSFGGLSLILTLSFGGLKTQSFTDFCHKQSNAD